MGIEHGVFRRTELLFGTDLMNKLFSVRVIIFGIGGVGSWCAESLVRSGIQFLTIVDSDRICVTNINRQSMATLKTVGEVKVNALKNRLLEINPKVSITAIQMIYNKDNADLFHLDDFDYIIDAIDSIENKVLLIQRATMSKGVFFSSMGSALKIDPLQIKTGEFWDVKGCPLAAALRRKIRKTNQLPYKKFLCVFSEEVLENMGQNKSCGTEQCLCPKGQSGPGVQTLLNHEWCSLKAQINGTVAHTTAIFGFTLAGLLIKDIYTKHFIQAN